MEEIEKIIFQCTIIKPYILEEIRDAFEYHVYEKNHYLSRIGEVEKYSYFIIDGCVRYFTEKDNGDDRILHFFFAKSYISSFASYISQEPAEIGLQCITKTKVLAMHKDRFDYLTNKYHEVETSRRKIMERIVLQNIAIHQDMMTLNSKEKYQKLLKQSPDFVEQIPLKHLALYLGIHPNSLSRIRKEFKEDDYLVYKV